MDGCRQGIAVSSLPLPESSYVAFNAFRLKEPELLWVNEDLIEQTNLDARTIMDRFSYSTFTEGVAIDDKTHKTFLADRYGSRYEACNGGSARCGIESGWQVKGIGSNPLISLNISSSHTDGKLCLSKAIAEAVWGEICHRELPYGAIRTLAIIKTGMLTKTHYGLKGLDCQPCALVVREMAIRPAHFERATFFWPHQENISLRDNDACRVKESIEIITRFLPSQNDDLIQGLENMLLRIAKQIAVSRVKGIPHGSLTSSNISIDGRFLDFGTMTAVPDFANYVLAAGQGGLWQDHLLIVEWLRHVFFYINKYHPQGLEKNETSRLLDFFIFQLERAENFEVARQIGLTGNSEYCHTLGKKIKDELQKGKQSPRTFNGFEGIYFFQELEAILTRYGIAPRSLGFHLRNKNYSWYSLCCQLSKLLESDNLSCKSVCQLISSFIDKGEADA